VDQLFKFIAWLLATAYEVGHSYALSIVFLTLVVMTITTPLTLKGTKSMLQMQRLQPEMKKIQERYRDDRQKMNEEMLAFYKANNINPVGGCLPMFIQLPVFAVLYRVLTGLTTRVTNYGIQLGTTTAQLRDALPFTEADQPKRNFNPSYISKDSELYTSLTGTSQMKSFGIDLADSASSALTKSLGHSLPYLLLIVIVAVTGVVQQRQIQGRSSSTAVNSQQQAIMKIMPFFLPVISFGLPAGLVVYFVISNLWRVGQQAFITRTIYASHTAQSAARAVVETTAEEVPAPAKPARASQSTAPARAATATESTAGRSVLGRNRRDGEARAARLPEPAKQTRSTPAGQKSRVTPSGAGPSRPAKNKKKRK
jgi:YidC/Oxa1 family membrane protein insertase